MRRAYAIWFVLALAALILVVEGYMGYRYYNQYYGRTAASDNAAVEPGESTPPGTTEDAAPATKNNASETLSDQKTAFTHRATSGNTTSNSTYIDHPLTNQEPDAILLVTQVWEPDVDVVVNHPTGVWYDSNRGGRWAIFNQDLAPMPEGAL